MKMKGMNVYFQKLIAELCGMVQVPKSSDVTTHEYKICQLDTKRVQKLSSVLILHLYSILSLHQCKLLTC